MPKPVLRGKELQKAIIDLAHHHSWKVAHFTAVQDIRGVWRTPAQADGVGWPDLVLCRDRLITIEVKGDGDSMKQAQVKWLDALTLAGVEAHVIRPSDWRDGTVDRILA